MISFSKLGQLGQFGNQCFQAAATIALADKHSVPYLLPKTELHEAFPNLKYCSIPNSSMVYKEPDFSYKEIPYVENMDLLGYFQSWKYFNNCRGLINNLFKFPNDVPELTGVTAIHVRRGDYVKLGQEYYVDLSFTDYYVQAIGYIKSSKYYVFSDDLEYCKKMFKGNEYEFISSGSPWKDLQMISSCENVIMANSSFSWWGSYLNINPDKKIIAPKKWFGSKLPHNTQDLLLPEWIKI